MANIVGNPQDFFRYTSGRWIWDERQQLRERYREFDILEVQKIATELSSSGSCVSMAKIGEGSYNKSFKLTMGNGKTVIARILNLNTGPAFLTTALEVTLMDFITKCPIDFSSEEICKHYKDGEGWNEVQDFWDALSGILSKDGWTSHATYDQALSIYSQIQAHTAPHSSHNALPKE
ncbi:unnamed protein product [Aspergillus oryzae var. brunneus]|uniref:Altered inheritance of mitochondria protein 9, mitochondrial n=2 Tax=Aspergillus oryzae TaxID=5062 RepID=A0AAN5BT74_ASPOZ|nr:unnamed protein product [Aspergillus oryzae]GMG23650.1 unnamed protein product [Aspergillus oryzae]GMG46693.1 unnamed protein product [Aspergillus oryzae var. brunneus]